MPQISSVYKPRKPQESQYYQCIDDNFESLEQVYDDRFAKKYGFFRPYVKQVIYRYLDCGILHNGFARVKCGECGHEFLQKILQHLGLLDRKVRPPPKTGVLETGMDTSASQLPSCEDYLYRDPEYPIEAYAS
jgi:hypothetical protein